MILLKERQESKGKNQDRTVLKNDSLKSCFRIVGLYFVLLICLTCIPATAQNKTIDSLNTLLKNATEDSTKCMILKQAFELDIDSDLKTKFVEECIAIAESNLKKYKEGTHLHLLFKKHKSNSLAFRGSIYLMHGESVTALKYFESSNALLKEMGNTDGLAANYGNMGNIYKNRADFHKAIYYYSEALKLMNEMGNIRGAAASYGNLGIVFKAQGNIQRALEYYEKAMKMYEQAGNKKGVAQLLNNIAVIYHDQGDIQKCVEYYNKSLKIKSSIGDKGGMALTLGNLGVIYFELKKYEMAMECFEKSLKLEIEVDHKVGIANLYDEIGNVYSARKKFDLAMEYYNKSLAMQEKLDDKVGVMQSLGSIGVSYLDRNEPRKALPYILKSMKIGKETGVIVGTRDDAKMLFKIYKQTGDDKLALENFELYIKLRDSINNESTRKASIRSQLKYEYEKQAAADSVAHAKESEIKSAELSRQSAEIKAKKNQQYALFGGLFLVILFSVFMFNRFKVTQKQKFVIEQQKEIVEEQKLLVEHKQREILDSIRYAKRIQLAQIPTEKRVGVILKRLKL